MFRKLVFSLMLVFFLAAAPLTARSQKTQKAGPLDSAPILWCEPADIASRDPWPSSLRGSAVSEVSVKTATNRGIGLFSC
jgi:hypothetical protein